MPKEQEIKVISQTKIKDEGVQISISTKNSNIKNLTKKLKEIPKKIYIGLILTIAILSVSVIIYNYRQNMMEQSSCNEQSNIHNGSLVVKDGAYIFFSNLKDKCIYKMKEDGTNKTKIVQQEYTIAYLEFNSGYIYYIVFSSNTNPALYRIKKDGTEKKKIINRNILTYIIYKNKLYYIASDLESATMNNQEYELYKANLDGSDEKRLAKNVNLYSNIFNVYKDTIYFLKAEKDTNESSLTKINADGKNETKILDSHENIYLRSVSKDSIIYIKEDGLYISDINMRSNKKLVSTNKQIIVSTNINDEYIYYSLVDLLNEDSRKSGIYRIKIDGTESKKICNTNAMANINIVGDWIYYYESKYEENDAHVKFSRVKKDGSKNEVLEEYDYDPKKATNGETR